MSIKYLSEAQGRAVCDGMDSDFSMKWIGGKYMNVTGAQSIQSTYHVYDRQSSKSATQSSGKTSQTDSVSISEEAKSKAENAQTGQNLPEKATLTFLENGLATLIDPSGNTLPIDKYKLIDGEYTLEDSSVNDQNGLDSISRNFFDLMPRISIKPMQLDGGRTGFKISEEDQNAVKEYTSLLSEIFRDVKNDTGITSNEDLQNQISSQNWINSSEYELKQSLDLRNEIYQRIGDRLSADPRGKELMAQFHVQLGGYS